MMQGERCSENMKELLTLLDISLSENIAFVGKLEMVSDLKQENISSEEDDITHSSRMIKRGRPKKLIVNSILKKEESSIPPKKRGRPPREKVLELDYNDELSEMENWDELQHENIASKADNDENYDSGSDFEDEVQTPKKRGRPKKGEVRPSQRKNLQFECENCDKEFKQKRLMMKHKLVKHNIDIICDICQETFSKFLEYKKHMAEQHSPHICTECGEQKISKQALNKHIEAKHGEDTSCHYCARQFSTMTSCNQHIRTAHEGELIKCSKCEYTCVFKANMNKHFLRIHTEQNKVTCQYCGEVFKDIKRHIERTNCGQEGVQKKLAKCDQCDKTFSCGSKMREHKKAIHSGIRDQLCGQCSYSTYSRYNLKLHIAKVHMRTGLVKEQCPYCEKESTNIAYHIKLYHSEQCNQVVESKFDTVDSFLLSSDNLV